MIGTDPSVGHVPQKCLLRGGETFFSSVFLINLEKRSQWPGGQSAPSLLLPSQAASNLTVSRHNLVAIQLSIKTSFTWQSESLSLIFLHFRLAQVTRLRHVFFFLKWATLISSWNNGGHSGSSAAAFASFRTASEGPALCLFASLSQQPQQLRCRCRLRIPAVDFHVCDKFLLLCLWPQGLAPSISAVICRSAYSASSLQTRFRSSSGINLLDNPLYTLEIGV